MKTSFNPKTRTWARPFPQSLAQHDIVYQSPPEDALQGLPIGNGDMGMLLWTEGSRLVAVINKIDLFDDLPDKGDGMVPRVEYGHESTLRHGARLTVDFNMPIFDILYLQEFKACLGLADATVHLKSQTPFLGMEATAFASNSDRVIVLKCHAQGDDSVRIHTEMERYGSRPYAYWYSTINRDATLGLEGTRTTVNGETLLIRQQLGNLHFVVGVRILGDGVMAERLNRHAGRLSLCEGDSADFTLLITALTSENTPDPQAEVINILDHAVAKGFSTIHETHAREWENFWKASFLSIPNDYIENIWYLNLYYANSSCRGAYPPRFNNYLWSWNRDVANWVFYFHWNMHNFIWPLHAANHAELALPFFQYRSRSLPNAKIFARNQQKREGAFYADQADRLGRNNGCSNNQTPGSQIALLYWKHFKYTGDRRFLEEQAWPVIRETTRYYASLVEEGADGVYRSRLSQAYEGSPLFDEVITDTAMIRALMPAAVECAVLLGCAGPETERWRMIGENMNGFHTQPLDEDEYETNAEGKRILRFGIGRGKEVLSGKAFTVGIYRMLEGEDRAGFRRDALPEEITKPLEDVRKGDRLRRRYGNPDHPVYYGIPDPEIAPVFPGELIGLKDKGSELFNTSVDQVRLHTTADRPLETLIHGGTEEGCCGWCPYPVVLARLGLAEEAAAELVHSVITWQFYCQGFSHYSDFFTKDKNYRWHTNTVTEQKTGKKLLSPAWPFRHFTLEAIPIVCAAVNEMLLQSYEGFIRLLPATPENWNGSFMLAAEGGFLVHTQYDHGIAEWVAVESLHGKRCRIVNPWDSKLVYVTVLDRQGQVIDSLTVSSYREGPDSLTDFDTLEGMLYLLSVGPDILDHWIVEAKSFEPNREMKSLGHARLGLPRIY